ncbi:DUF485 domain-containing protein [Candidatus Albibeggiatoa sp. nov. NOAA]|uniref:DUF485 domain-containing protein n=1 Tax=Candidatus Albibeggiatoa sp. nov. NOAA TaxID=3162724 RepID=UPI0032F58AAB|nr:DUF485 domain-containing protein [Thiotrichaceae bacterium]
MQQDLVERIKNNPKYEELVSKRASFSWILSIVMLVIYYAFILVIAFSPSVLGTPISDSSVITIGIPIGVAIIISAFILTGIYTVRANGEFDELSKQIKEEAK